MTSTATSSAKAIRIATRKSQLALVQTYWVQEQLQKSFPNQIFEVDEMSTKGDKILDVAPVSYTHLTLPTIYSV